MKDEEMAEEYRKDLKSKFFLSEPQLDLACQGYKDGYNKAKAEIQEKLKAALIADLKERMQYSTSPSCTKGMELFIRSIEEWEIKENDSIRKN